MSAIFIFLQTPMIQLGGACFGICMKLVRFIKMCLNKPSCKFFTLDRQMFFW